MQHTQKDTWNIFNLRIFSSNAIIMLLLVLFGSVFFSTMMAQDLYRVTASSLNVRVSPSTKAQAIGYFKENDTITVFEIENQWAKIYYKNKEAYVFAKYLEPLLRDITNTKQESETLYSNNDSIFQLIDSDITSKDVVVWNNWGIDFLPSIAVGVSSFRGSYSPKPTCALKFDFNFQYYQKRNGVPRGWISESSLGYTLNGGGGMLIHYLTMQILPAGYAYTFRNKMTIYGLAGVNLNVGGGSLNAYYRNRTKRFSASTVDVGVQIKIAVEWRNFAIATSYNMGFIDAVQNTSMSLRNYGCYLHAYYRLWNIPNNQIYRP